jgi:SAM-dependent methyltransferase
MSFTDLFSEKARFYSAARPRYPDALFAHIAEHAPALTHAWDCGAGNGQAAASLATHFARVSATDPSAEQISHAIPAPNIEYSVQPAEQTNFSDQSFDAICVAQALHWFNFADFFAEVRRTARPGAIFYAWGYDWPAVSPDFDDVFKLSVMDVIAPYWAPQNRILWAGYKDVPFPFPRISTPPLQIEVRWNLYQLLAYVATWSAARKCEATLGPTFLRHAERALMTSWGTPDEERAITMPLHVIAGRIA